MIHTGKFERMEIFLNTKGETPEQIKAKKGCTTIINGILFNGDGSLCCDVRSNGQWITNDQYTYYGLGWSGNNIPERVHTNDAIKYENFISCVPVLPTMKRGRSALGFNGDEYTTMCVSDGNGPMTIPEVEAEMQKRCKVYLIVDGGGSAYMDSPSGMVDTTYQRKTANRTYILIWEKTEQKKGGNNLKKGIDVSEHQGVINWELVKPQIDFAMIRAGYGKNNIDKQFIRNITECNRLNIPCGVYWFSYAYTAEMAKAEADYCINAIKPYVVSYPVCFDFEYDSVTNAQKKGVTVTKELASALVTAFCTTVESAKYYGMNYANADYMNRYFNSDIAARYDLWLAAWPATVDLERPPRTCGIWQYSNSATISGITGKIDVNAAYKDYAQLIKSWGLNHLAEQSPAEPIPPVDNTMYSIQLSKSNADALQKYLAEKSIKIEIQEVKK